MKLRLFGGRDPERRLERYTIIIVPEGVSRVRRFHVRRAAVLRSAAVGGLVAGLLLVGLVDWARLRIDAVDVARLRAETRAQSQDIVRFTAQLEQMETQLTSLSEFERKVRVIANLPKAAGEHTHDDRTPGVGGDGEEEVIGAPPGEPPDRPVPLPSDAALVPAPLDADLIAFPSSEATVLAHLSQRAGSLADAAHQRGESMQELLQQLDGKSRQLAATPSIWPTEGWITSRFGRRISPFTGRPQFHAGIDIAAPFGTAVVSPGRGRVRFAGRKGALGRTIEIDHGWGIRTTYGHLAEILVKKGQELERGERVGTVGSSGRSTGPHLHYGVSVHSKAVNPLDYVFE